MTKEQLKQNLEAANKTRREPRSADEINDIINKFETSEKNRIANIAAIKEQNKGYHRRLNDLFKDNDIELKDCRFYVSNLMGIFVHRKAGNKATVTFSFFNLNDYEECKDKLDMWSFKFHALQNYVLGKYTFDVDWKGRSEFAVYDAFVKNHKTFPAHYKNLSVFVGFNNPYLDDSNED